MMYRHTEKGLTLPEVLISVAILAGIAAVIAPMISMATKASVAMETQAQGLETRRTSQEVLTHMAGTAIFADEQTPELNATGTSTRFRFGSLTPSGNPAIVELIPTTDGTGLLLLILPLTASSGPSYESRLFDQSSSITFRYFGATTDRSPLTWHDVWNARKPPKLLHVSGQSLSDDEPSLEFDLLFTGQAPIDCEFDPVSRLCRNAE